MDIPVNAFQECARSQNYWNMWCHHSPRSERSIL